MTEFKMTSKNGTEIVMDKRPDEDEVYFSSRCSQLKSSEDYARLQELKYLCVFAWALFALFFATGVSLTYLLKAGS